MSSVDHSFVDPDSTGDEIDHSPADQQDDGGSDLLPEGDPLLQLLEDDSSALQPHGDASADLSDLAQGDQDASELTAGDPADSGPPEEQRPYLPPEIRQLRFGSTA
jgi:hypothetical protein